MVFAVGRQDQVLPASSARFSDTCSTGSLSGDVGLSASATLEASILSKNSVAKGIPSFTQNASEAGV